MKVNEAYLPAECLSLSGTQVVYPGRVYLKIQIRLLAIAQVPGNASKSRFSPCQGVC